MEKIVAHNTSLLIREYLLMKGGKGATPSEIHKYVKSYKSNIGYKPPNYFSFYKYIYILKELGLIKKRMVRIGYKTRPYYYIVKDRVDDLAWYHPQSSLYPATGLGSKRYSKLKAVGREPRGRRQSI